MLLDELLLLVDFPFNPSDLFLNVDLDVHDWPNVKPPLTFARGGVLLSGLFRAWWS
jgi:hypothetical protein